MTDNKHNRTVFDIFVDISRSDQTISNEDNTIMNVFNPEGAKFNILSFHPLEVV